MKIIESGPGDVNAGSIPRVNPRWEAHEHYPIDVHLDLTEEQNGDTVARLTLHWINDRRFPDIDKGHTSIELTHNDVVALLGALGKIHNDRMLSHD